MAGLKYNETQINELKQSKYVKNISSKSITFSLECKYEFLRLSQSWMFYKSIFKKLWFPEYIIESNVASEASKRWKRNEKTWEIEKKRGRVKKSKINFENMKLEEQNEYLQTEVAYLRELHKLKFWHYP